MARSEHISHLSGIELFAGCSKKDLGRIAAAGQEVKVAPGETIVSQGDVGRDAFVVLEGTATVKRGNRKVATLGPGDPIGEMSLLDKGPRTAYVVADGDMRLLRLSAKDFGDVLDDVPALSKKMLATLAGRIRELDRKIFG